jgi:hypothetical protein
MILGGKVYLTESHFTVKELEGSISAPFSGWVTCRAGVIRSAEASES